MEKLNIQLRVVFYKEEENWIAHCLEMDVMGHGGSIEEAFEELRTSIGIQVAESVRHDNPANLFMSADARFLRMFFAGKHKAIREVVVESAIGSRTEVDGVVIEDIDLREYDGDLAFA